MTQLSCNGLSRREALELASELEEARLKVEIVPPKGLPVTKNGKQLTAAGATRNGLI